MFRRFQQWLQVQLRLLEIGFTPVIVVAVFRNVDRVATGDSRAASDYFLYGASHDLQDPLRMILIYAQLLQRRYGEELDEESRRVLGFVIEGARRMTDLARSLLTYARLEASQSGAPNQQNVRVSSYAAFEEALSNLRVPIEESNAEANVGGLPEVLGHYWKLVLVFQDLLNNVIKYSKASGHRQILVRAMKEDGFCRFSVSDRCVGFPQEHAQSVSNVFTRLHLDSSGTGLGLSICKRIVERRDERIRAESKPSEGSTFYFTLSAPEPSGHPARAGD